MPADFKFRYVSYPTLVGPDEEWSGEVYLFNEGDEAGRFMLIVEGDMTGRTSLMPNHLEGTLGPGESVRLIFYREVHSGPMNYTLHVYMMPGPW